MIQLESAKIRKERVAQCLRDLARDISQMPDAAALLSAAVRGDRAAHDRINAMSRTGAPVWVQPYSNWAYGSGYRLHATSPSVMACTPQWGGGDDELEMVWSAEADCSTPVPGVRLDRTDLHHDGPQMIGGRLPWWVTRLRTAHA